MADSADMFSFPGVIAYAAITVLVLPEDFKKDDKAVPSYAFPCYIVGTSLLFAGMLFCAIIIERSSKQYYLKPIKCSKLYWLQPGNQHVGDQVFGAFMAVKQGPGLQYIKSTRLPKHDSGYVELYTILGSTMLGFIIQFIGLRGLHASVILAQLGSTLLMSIVRTCLRTERMTPEENLLENKKQRDLAVQKKQELDLFAFHLHNVESFEPTSSISAAVSRSNSSNTCVARPDKADKPLANQIIETRAFLAEITSKTQSHLGSNVSWDDMPIRKVARSLAETIGTTMDLLSSWGVDYGKEFEFPLSFEFIECTPEGSARTVPSHGNHPISIQRRGDALKWRVDQNELEAIIGLSTWSLYKSDEEWQKPLNRMVGLSEFEAGQLETYLYFHKWIFRQTEAKMVSANMIDSSRRLFGFDSNQHSFQKEILVVSTENDLETMMAQDIYMQFLRKALMHLSALKDDTSLHSGIQYSFFAKNRQVDELILCFENCMLGSREDALLCTIPTLRSLDRLPKFAGDSAKFRKQVEDLVSQNDWKMAFEILEWISERSEGVELQHSVFELGYLCRRALMAHDTATRQTGLEYTCKLLAMDIRKNFLASRRLIAPEDWSEAFQIKQWWEQFSKQFGWIAWHISLNTPSAKCIQPTLKQHGVLESLGTAAETGQDADFSPAIVKATQEFLTLSAWDVHVRDLEENYDELGYAWALQQNFDAIAYFSLVRWAEIGTESPMLCQRAFTIAARQPTDWGIKVLLQHDADIGSSDERTISALLQAIDQNNLKVAEALLKNGANPNGNEKGPDVIPLGLCAQRDLTDMATLLLKHGASVYVTDRNGMSALHWASNENKLRMAGLLISSGADVGRFGADGVTPLHCAVKNGYLQMAELILDAGADINAPGGNRQKTPLMFAASSCFPDVVHMLLAKGADIHAQDADGSTALDWAKISNCSDATKIIEKAARA